MRRCWRCGNDVSAEARFCPRCGENLDPAGIDAAAEIAQSLPPPNTSYEQLDFTGAQTEAPPPPGFYHWPPRQPQQQPPAGVPYYDPNPTYGPIPHAPYPSNPGYAPASQAPYAPNAPFTAGVPYGPGMSQMPNQGYPAYGGMVPYAPQRFIESRYPPHLLVTATPLRRLGGYALDWLILLCTLGIGWLIWFCIVAPNGQTPGKQILGMYVMRDDGTRAGGWYTWFRQVLLKGAIYLANMLTVGLLWLVAAMWCLWDKDHQCLWDKLGSTYIAYSPRKFKPLTARELAQTGTTPPLLGQRPY